MGRTWADYSAVGVMIDWRSIPLFVTNKNRLDVGFKEQITWYLDVGLQNITVIDNGSTYPPLLVYYDSIKEVKVVRPSFDLGARGAWAFWDLGLNKEFTTPVLISDSDCVPDKDCPKDLVQILLDVLDRHPDCKKVSPGIRIDDIPDTYRRKKEVLESQSVYWKDEVLDSLPLYNAHTDTTTTLVRNGEIVLWSDRQFRIGAPYLIQHKPWYLDSSNPTVEERYYSQHVHACSTWQL